MASQANGVVGWTPSEVHQIPVPRDTASEQAGPDPLLVPFIEQALGREMLRRWEMLPAEQAALLFLLQQVRPQVAIEIGTRFGGSLQVLARFCRQVYALDIDPAVPLRLQGQFPNVEYLIGPSEQTLPLLLDRLHTRGEPLGFALVDGDHSTEGVRKDLDCLLRHTPTVPFFIIMHDSFNPQCRQGLRSASWAANPYVHKVELDFVPGVVNPYPAYRGQLWGGLALACLSPHKRQGPLEVSGYGELTFQIAAAPPPPPPGLRNLAGAALRQIKHRLLGTGVSQRASA